MGENGAGKTTLMRILYGAISPSEGSFSVEGTVRNFKSSKEAIAAGIGMVSQHYAVIPELTCLQNLMLGAEPGAFLNGATAAARAQELADQMGFQFDWHKEASTLGPAGAQKLEILKLLWRNARIMILDEPTAMLSPADGEALFESLQKLTASGATVLLVTHRLPEVFDFSKNVTVLRGGKQVANRPVSGLDAKELSELIVGHSLATFEQREVTRTTKALEVSNLTVKGDRGDDAVKSVSFDVFDGELVGIAGVDGNGQKELFQNLFGVRPSSTGASKLYGEPIDSKATAERVEKGVRLIAEDRHTEAVVERWPLSENALMGFQRMPQFQEKGQIMRQELLSKTEGMIARFNTKCSGPSQPMGALSGGNQQRFVVARALAEDPKLILAFQPTRGLDIDATRAVYEGIRQQCAAGAGALVVSFDLDELLEFCDRILVMNGGEMKEAKVKDRATVGQLMVGAE